MTHDEEVIAAIDEYFGEEELDPELAACLYAHETLGHVIKHPLVISAPHHAMLNKRVNQQLHAKCEALAEAKADSQWFLYVFLHERPYRLQALCEVAQCTETDEEYWELVSDVWQDSENIHENEDTWRDLLTENRFGREAIMTEEERAKLAALPEVVTIYRGVNGPRAPMSFGSGMAWTLDRDRAGWFANRFFAANPTIYTATGPRSAIIAVFDGRSEDEVVVMPEDVTVINRETF